MSAKKSFGQHFLSDTSIAQKIVEAAGVKPDEMVIEVGPGKGALTDLLQETANAGLCLIEADKDFLEDLTERYPDAALSNADAATIDFDSITNERPWVFVSNLPYNAANAIIMNALTATNPPARLIVMVQKEVADRMLGLEGSRGVLSVAIGLYTDVERLFNVKPGSFQPSPKVDSSVLRLTLNKKHEDPEAVIRLAKAGFSSRRKQLHRNLADHNVSDSEATKAALEQLNLTPNARAEELSLEQWVSLYESLA